MAATQGFMQAPLQSSHFEPLTRSQASYAPLQDFDLSRNQGYQQQYGDLYFLRLAKLKSTCEKIASEAWTGYEIAGETVQHVERVLDVRQGDLCWIVGTVFLDMPLKPNILDDISKDHWIAAPPPRAKYTSPDGSDKIMLEDESGRLRLMGEMLKDMTLVTGCIIAVMGTENADGDFEVVDVKLPDLPSQPERWSLENQEDSSNQPAPGSKIALVSGLGFTGNDGDTLLMDLLTDYLLGESSAPSEASQPAQVSRLIVLGNSIADSTPLPANNDADTKRPTAATSKKYGYDASAYNPAPTQQLDTWLSELLPSISVTLMPGPSDPANVSMPQQPLHAALFPQSRTYADPPRPPDSTGSVKPNAKSSFPLHSATNPLFASIGGQLSLFSAGQPTTDILKYLPLDPASLDPSTLEVMAATLRWRLIAPTAPDTLWCYPYQSGDPFVLGDKRCPRLYCVGNAPDGFGTTTVRGSNGAEIRLVAVPCFRASGELVVVDIDTMDVEVVRFRTYE